jgi:serine/threonine protein kinase
LLIGQVAVKALIVYSTDQAGEAKEKKIKVRHSMQVCDLLYTATLQRIRRELRTCALLKHRNILPVYGWTSAFGPFIAIVSPWAENGNLVTYMEHFGATLTVIRRFQIVSLPLYCI